LDLWMHPQRLLRRTALKNPSNADFDSRLV
jgi:hypothetical protein